MSLINSENCHQKIKKGKQKWVYNFCIVIVIIFTVQNCVCPLFVCTFTYHLHKSDTETWRLHCTYTRNGDLVYNTFAYWQCEKPILQKMTECRNQKHWMLARIGKSDYLRHVCRCFGMVFFAHLTQCILQILPR